MKYDFTSVMERRGHDAIAVDLIGHASGFAPEAPRDGFDVIPMWVADMNFPVAPPITNALAKRIEHPAYGYFAPRAEYYESIINWHTTRNGVQNLKRKHIGYENGVLGGLVSALNAFASPGDAVLVHSPTYIGFTSSITNAGFRIVHSPLVQDEQGIWRMDYADMERKISENNIHVAVFCSPHNPCGRVWEREEIEAAMEVYRTYDCAVISDEIWSDIVLPPAKHIPTQLVSKDARYRTVALYAPSKTFNLAGLVGSYHIIYSDYMRGRVQAQSSKSHYNDMNVLSMHALIGAYSEEGAEWVDELREVIAANVNWACDYIEQHFDGIQVFRPQGTYMLFLDCSRWCAKHHSDLDWLLHAGWRVGVGWQDGRPFHGKCHIRMNLALPTARVQEAFGRLSEYVFYA